MPTHYAAIARHGDYEQPERVPSAHLPYPLTDRGRQQALALGDELHGLARERHARLDLVLDTSTLLRAYQTGVLAAERLQQVSDQAFVISQFDALCERSVGAMANLRVDQIEALLERDPRFDAPPPGWKADSAYRLPVPGAESLHEAGRRVAAHIVARMQEVSENASVDTIKVFVGHGAAFRHAAAELGILKPGEIPQLSMHHARTLLWAYDPLKGFQPEAGEWKRRSRGTAYD